jgi:hypothetical protein
LTGVRVLPVPRMGDRRSRAGDFVSMGRIGNLGKTLFAGDEGFEGMAAKLYRLCGSGKPVAAARDWVSNRGDRCLGTEQLTEGELTYYRASIA